MAIENSLLHALRRRWRKTSGDAARALPGIYGQVHIDDLMLYDESDQAITDYRRAGRSAIDNIDEALRSSDRTFDDIETCLDFGCGHGRVLRHLCEQIPAAGITAIDVDEGGVRFCAEEFGVKPLVSSWNIADIRLGIYDLIWSGSVFTHLDETSCETLFDKLGHSLLPTGGVLVFSIHGQHSLDNLEGFYDGIYADKAPEIRRQVADTGFSFDEYPENSPHGDFPAPYGMTWHRPEYFEKLAAERFGGELRLTMWKERGWDLHHDVLAFQRRA